MDITLEHPFFSTRKEFYALCKPLFTATPITFFDYARYYHDGHCVFLCQETEVDYEVLKLNLVPNLNELHQLSTRYFVLSTTIQDFEAFPLRTEMLKKNIEITSYANVLHRLFIVFNAPHYIEMYEFGVGNSINNIFEFFMNHIQSLEQFCIYFRNASTSLLKEVAKNKVIFDPIIEPALFADIQLKNDNGYNKLIDTIDLKKYFIQGINGKKNLTKREFECLIWSAKNRSTKQIGKILSLSPRTVEDYLANIKNKLGCRSKGDLIEIANNDPLTRSFTENH